MKSIGQIKHDERTRAALQRHPRVLQHAIAWLDEMGDNDDDGDAIGRALSAVLEQWAYQSEGERLTPNQFAAHLALAYNQELGLRDDR